MVWRVILPVAALITLAHGGGRTLSAQESEQFLALFRRYCNGGAGPSQDGNTFYYCKTSDERITKQIDHSSEINGGETPKQVIFVQPPKTNYVHNVALGGSPGSPQQTDIYVLPSTAEHQLQLQDTRSAVTAVKPSLYFLNDDSQNGGAGNGGGFGGGNRPIPSTRPNGFSNQGQRPSAPPPHASDPAIIGVGTGLISAGGQQSSGGGGGGQGGYSSAYGAPVAFSARNQRNAPRNYRTL